MTNQEAIEIITNAVQTENMTIEQDKALAIVQKSFSLINRQQSEIKNQNRTIEMLNSSIKCYKHKIAEIENEFDDLNCKLYMAYDSISDKQAEIERLKSMNQSKLDTIHDLQAQNEILSKNADTAFQEGLNERRDLFEPEIKAKVVKEFAERLKFKIINTPFGVNCTGENEDYKEGCLCGLVANQNNIIDMIDTVLKEIVGEDK